MHKKSLTTLIKEISDFRKELHTLSKTDRVRINNLIYHYNTNKLYKFYYDLKFNSHKMNKYRQYLNTLKQTDSILERYIGYIEILSKYYGSNAYWEFAQNNVEVLLINCRLLFKYKNSCLFNLDYIVTLRDNFIEMANSMTKKALEDPNSFYNKSISNNKKSIRKNIPKDVLNALNVLGVSDNLDLESIKKEYKKLAIKYHPDRGGSTQDMAKINVAYDKIINYYKKIS
jgi:hypothetical protein